MNTISDTFSEIYRNPYPISIDKFLVSIVFRGEPIPLARTRIGKSGRWYMPKRSATYIKQLRESLREDLGTKENFALNKKTISQKPIYFGVRAFFYRKNHQRVDVDNLLKAVFDAGTGIVWDDDCDIIEVFGKKSVDPEDPRVAILIYDTGEKQITWPSQCKKCGDTIDNEHPWKLAKHCVECRIRKVYGKCKICGVETNEYISWAKQRPRRLDACPEHRADIYPPTKNKKGVCLVCGGPKSKEKYKSCRKCWIGRRKEVMSVPKK